MNIGFFFAVNRWIGNDIYEERFAKAEELGIHYCQINIGLDKDEMTEERADNILASAKKHGVKITHIWRGWTTLVDNQADKWNFIDGPRTIGIMAPTVRKERVEEMKTGSDFTKRLGIDKMITHVGFIPETPQCREYEDICASIKEVAEYCKANGQYFLFETGQETPVTLLRTIEKVNTGNLGINLDPANLICYGKGNPVDALDVFGKYVMGVHGKDGFYPTEGTMLGKEARMGSGKVHFERLIPRLLECGYNGCITIEREISGEQQIEDVKYAKQYLTEIMKANGVYED